MAEINISIQFKKKLKEISQFALSIGLYMLPVTLIGTNQNIQFKKKDLRINLNGNTDSMLFKTTRAIDMTLISLTLEKPKKKFQ